MARHAAALATETESRSAVTGELRLFAALLALAVKDARGGDAAALAWIATDEAPSDRAFSFSFSFVCEALGVAPEWVRAQVARGGRSIRPAMRLTRRLRAAA